MTAVTDQNQTEQDQTEPVDLPEDGVTTSNSNSNSNSNDGDIDGDGRENRASDEVAAEDGLLVKDDLVDRVEGDRAEGDRETGDFAAAREEPGDGEGSAVAEGGEPGVGESSAAAEEPEKRKLWRKRGKREEQSSGRYARVGGGDGHARGGAGATRSGGAEVGGASRRTDSSSRKDGSSRADRTEFSARKESSARPDSAPRPAPSSRTDAASAAEASTPWDDGLIARRVNETAAAQEQPPVVEARASGRQVVMPLAYDGSLRSRLDALRELVGLSRARLDSKTLAEAGRVLDEAAARRRLSGQHTVVAIAGATGSGKSQLFNALAGVTISETGVRRPTTSSPLVCSWSDGAVGLIDRLGIPPRLRRRPAQSSAADGQLRGLVLVDLPDHDSAAVQHREQVDRVLALVDAVIWVVDPEKYADAVLHERYLRPMAGHAEIMFIVLNQTDRLPGEATDQVLDDLRRLLDEDGIALGEHGEPGATVLALSALTGDGVGDLREALGQFVAQRGAAARRISADVEAAGWRLRPVYAARRRTGLSEEARDEFSARLADAIGATAAGEAAERAWLRNANRACGTPWLRLWRWYQDRGEPPTGRLSLRSQTDEESTARQRVEQAVRTISDQASAGLPAPWAQAVREAAVRGAQGLPEALDELAARAGLPPGRPPRPGWWPAAVLVQAAMTILQVVGGLWLVAQIIGVMAPNLGVPVLLMVAGIVGGPLVEWGCRIAARGPARRYGLEAERRLREAAAGCGRARVLDPVAAELLRYREVREQYGRVMGVSGTVR
ncbi:Predicted GTPase [Streptomyces sp. cf386]|uniref:YfjP family GTPase n=1 Tax=Streptomyces sp. cf386 TaxID=1761904 RepID=UPI0008917958|nr:YfjP family GTPase [Streptomyces sp. cf386]SDO40476.1 Predicted GTPase [Streptomyces sp. cf386]